MDDLLDTLRLAIHNIRKTGLVKDGETVQSSALKIINDDKVPVKTLYAMMAIDNIEQVINALEVY
jgi:predicted regulator of amino acid metabolism with ACT domain